jgi:hypothetical protein
LDFNPSREIFADGTFAPGWSHIANLPLSTGQDTLLFYNASTGSASIGIPGPDDFRTVRDYEPGEFGHNRFHLLPHPLFQSVVVHSTSPSRIDSTLSLHWS